MLGLVALAASTRYEVTLTILVLYFGLLDGVIKLKTGNQLVSSLRDLMIAAICIGVLVRMVVRREKVGLPPLSGWVIAFVVLVADRGGEPTHTGGDEGDRRLPPAPRVDPVLLRRLLLMRSKSRFRTSSCCWG